MSVSQSTQQDRELATQAKIQFTSAKYDDALQTLAKIKSDSKTSDPKVQHNTTVANYYQNNCTEPKKLLDELQKIKKRIDDKLQEQEESDEVQGVIYEEADSYVTLYNMAVINFQLRQYATTLSILETLFQNIEPMDENLAIKICLLLGELYLQLRYKDKVSLVIGYLEKTFPQFVKDGSNDKKDAEDKESENAVLDITPTEFRYQLHILKAKLHLLQKNLKGSKREVKLALSAHHPHLSHSILLLSTYLKANLEYSQGNFSKSIKLLNSFQKSNEKHIAAMYFNNMGCIHYKMKKYHAASYYFTRALKENEISQETSESKGVALFSRNRRLHILYNMGSKLLVTGNPELAFKCYQEASLLYYKSPKLWLRLAECCIGAHAKKVAEIVKNKGGRSSLIKRSTGSGSTKRIVLPSNDPNLKGISLEDSEATDEALGVQFGSLSLEYGAKSIRNALFLISRIESASTTVTNPGPNTSLSNSQNIENTNTGNAKGPTNVTTNSTVITEDDLMLKLSVYAAGAYIALCCNNPVLALQYSKDLLNSKKQVDYYRFLGNMYATEALCMLGRPQDALAYLNPATLGITDNSQINIPSSPYSTQTQEPVLNAKYTLFVNMAVVHVLRDDLKEAQNAVTAALNVNRAPSALLLQVYLELRKGNTDAALNILKVNSGVNFAQPKVGATTE